MKNKMRRLTAILICVCMVFALLPAQAIAVDVQSTGTTSNTQDWSGYTSISTKEELDAIRNDLAGNYYLTADIVFTEEDFAEGGAFYNDGAGWIPVGSDFLNSFTGIFDGNGHYISGLQVNNTNSGLSGLFGCCKGTIQNLGLVDANIYVETTGSQNAIAGTITGLLHKGSITNCYSSGTVSAYRNGKGYSAMAGGIVGQSYTSNISECFNQASVTANDNETTQAQYVGGVIGHAVSNSVIESCYNTGNITAEGYYGFLGGIVGYADNITISKCYNTGAISALCASTDKAANAGGITACLVGTISNCYNIGPVNADGIEYANAGGIASSLYGTIEHTYNIGQVTLNNAKYTKLGAIVGEISTGEVADSYYLNNMGIGVGKGSDTTVKCTESQLRTGSVYAGFGFEETWEFAVGNGYKYPTLVGLEMFVVDDTAEFNGGSGTAEDPYYVASKTQLNNVRNHLDGHFMMVNNIVFSESDFAEGGAFFNDGAGWEPIGENYYDSDLEVSVNNPFTGTFDGNGHTISGIVIHSAKSRYIGLFGCNEGSIKNLGVINANIEVLDDYGDTAAGGITGSTEGSIENCFFSGNIMLSTLSGRAYAGGISGTTGEGIIAISNCYNNGTIEAIAKGLESGYSDSLAGGIVGSVWNGTVSDCYNTGSISSSANTRYTSCAGGIAGTVADRGGEIASCFNTGYISTRDCAGGIAGRFYDDASVTNCYNTGKIEGTKYAGGIAARTNGTVTSCYNLGEIICANGYAGGLVGNTYEFAAEVKGYFWDNELEGIGNCLGNDDTVKCTSDQMQQQSTYSDFDFNNIWIIDSEKNYPYPQLRNNKVAIDIQSVSIAKSPVKLAYLEGKETLDTTGAMINLNCANGFSLSIPLTNNMVCNFDNSKAGKQELIVTHGGKTCSYEIEIIAKSLDSLTLIAVPTKLTYIEGKEVLDVTDGKIALYYNNDTSEEIDITPDMVSGFNNAVIGKQTLIVTYGDKTCSYDVEIIKKSLDSIAVTSQPTKLTYLEGKDTLDVTGGKITLFYNNDTSEEINITSDMVSGFDNTAIGNQILTVTYDGKTCSYGVEIVAKSLDSVTLTTSPTKYTYLEGKDILDVSGGTVTLYYNNDTYEEIDITPDMVSGFNNEIVGKQTLTVTYGGKTCTYDVEIVAKSLDRIAVTSQPTKLTYLEGKDAIDVTGGKITLYYNNDSSEEVDITVDMVSGYDNSVAGIQPLTVTYNGLTCTYDVEIVAKQLASIAISKHPNKCSYMLNEEMLDVTGGKITLYYNNDTSEEVDMETDMVTGFDNTVLGSQTLTVTYEGLTAAYQIQIISEDAPQIIVNGGVATNGGIVVVSITLKNNPGIASMRLKVDYDSSAMSLIGVSDLGKIGSEIHSDQFTDPYVLCWANDTVTENFTANGDIVNLTFKISDTAALDSYEILVSYDYDKYDIHNVQVEKVKFYTVAGSVDVVDVLIGDVNGDGSLDTLDRLTLSRYLANWQGYTIDDINTIGADVNSDGSVDTLDRLILSRHLANWSGYEDITNPPT